MNAIWKFPLEGHHCEIQMPLGAKVLHVAVQFETPCLWALVDINASKETRRFVSVGTGQYFETPNADYVGTFMLGGGTLVWHVFDVHATDAP